MSKAKPQVIDDEERERVHERVAAVDVAKDTGMVCTRLPHPSRPGARQSTVWTVKARMGAVRALGRQLRRDGIEIVTLESTGDYWRIWFFVLEACGLAVQLVSAAQARNLPGRPKTDPGRDVAGPADRDGPAAGVLRAAQGDPGPAGLHPGPDPADPGADPLLPAAGKAAGRGPGQAVAAWPVKLTTVSAQDMIKAMIAGQRDPRVLAGLARTRMKAKHEDLVEALDGMFDDHHGELAQMLLDQIAFLRRADRALTARAAGLAAAMPAAWGVDARRDHRPGRRRRPGRRGAARRGPAGGDPRRQPRPGPGHHRGNRPGHVPVPHRRPPGVLGRAVPRSPPVRPPHPGRQEGPGRQLAAQRPRPGRQRRRPHPTFLGERYDRIARRRGKAKAQVAVARSILVIIWHLLADPAARYTDLGAGYYQARLDTDRKIRNHIRQIQALGFEVTITKTA